MPPDLDAVIFDLDDTLHDDTRAYRSAAREVAEELAAALGPAVTAAALFDVFVENAQAYWRTLDADSVTKPMPNARYHLWATALAAVGIEDEPLARDAADRYGTYRRKNYAPFPGTFAVLEALRGRGLRLGLITNGFASTHYEKLALLGLERSFDAVVMADEVGMVKPDPRMFLHACELLATPPNRAAMVGDRYYRDVVGARDAGLFTIHLDVHGESIPPGGGADATIRTIEDVLTVLC